MKGQTTQGTLLGLVLTLDDRTRIPLHVSPFSLVTLSESEREAAGIPKLARRFAFVYPIDKDDTAAASQVGGSWSSDAVGRALRKRVEAIPAGTAQEEARAVLEHVEGVLLGVIEGGGFMYVDADGQLLKLGSLEARKDSPWRTIRSPHMASPFLQPKSFARSLQPARPIPIACPSSPQR